MASLWLVLSLALPWVGAGAAVLMSRWRLVRIKAFSLVVVGASALALLGAVVIGHGHADLFLRTEWIPSYHAALRLELDAVSLPFALNVLGVALVTLAYAWGYFDQVAQPHLLYALLLAFIGGMLGTCLFSDAILFFICWESMLVSSSLLLVGWGEGDDTRRITQTYFVYTQAGSLLILLCLAWLIVTTGTSNMAVMAQGLAAVTPPQRALLAIGLLLGFGIKLAVVPLHVWLPDAHSIAPMPVTILLAAAMLSMGAYGIVRFPLMLLGAETIRPLEPVLLVVALGTQVYGALMCLVVRDIKRIVAYSSVSQMGYVLFGLATLSATGVAGSIMHVINHGVLKALLFMSVGIVIRATGRRQIEQLGGLGTALPRLAITLLIAAVAMAGLPPFSAFHSEWMILSGGLRSDYPLLGYLAFATPLLTAGYGLWLGFRLSSGAMPADMGVERVHPAMTWAAYGLIAVTFIEDLIPGPLYALADAAAQAILGGALR
jgi:NADH-quinone oxidoreductase subunit M